MTRAHLLESIRQRPEVGALIVGGGINGIGVYRDLALNGVDVLLLDRADFCSGSSAASSHMAHGGIRYLENGEFRMVAEAIRERNRLLSNASHLVQPLPTTIPIFRRYSGLLNAPRRFLGFGGKPAERGAVVVRLGLFLYDLLSGRKRVLPRHHFMGRTSSLKKWPLLHRRLRCTATYFDAVILCPERLAIDLLLDAEARNPSARALNYLGLEGAGPSGIQLRDVLTGELLNVMPRVFINATGPWIDHCNRALGHPTRLIGGTKGSHLVLDHPELHRALGGHEFFFENSDGRIVLLLPIHDRVLVGTSDLPIDDPDDARCTDQEVDYFIAMVRHVFPDLPVRREHIVFRYSGVRPLANRPGSMPGQVTRDHSIDLQEPESSGLPFPIYSLVGGKWTSSRAFAEQAAGLVLARLGLRRKVHTRDLRIGDGAARFSQDGTVGPPRLWQPVTPSEIGVLARKEKIVHLDDLLLRRTTWAMMGRVTMPVLRECAAALGAALNWSQEETEAEVRRTAEILEDRHGMHL